MCSTLICTLLAVGAAASPTYKEYAVGGNFLEAAVVHKLSKDLLVIGDPDNNEGGTKVSIAVLPGSLPANTSFSSYQVIDDGSVVKFPADIALVNDTHWGSKGIAFVTDSSLDSKGIARFERNDAGEWKLGEKYMLSELMPACDDKRRSFVSPGAIAMGPSGEIYVSVVVEQNTWCLLSPLNRCCQVTGLSTSVMQLNIPSGRGVKPSLTEVFSTKSFVGPSGFKDSYFHMRAMDVTSNGDIFVVGYGDDGSYWAHTAWVWERKTGKARMIGGQPTGQGGLSGDGGNATEAEMLLPWGVLAQPGQVFISEAGNADVRQIVDGIMSTVVEAPNDVKQENYNLMYFRKLHAGSTPNSALLTISGLGANSGRVIEFQLPNPQAAPAATQVRQQTIVV